MSKPRSVSERRGILGRFRRSARGGVAMEFALLVPALMLLTAAIIEFVALMYDYQAATDATRVGVREALIGPAVANLNTLQADSPVICTASGGVASCGTTGVTADADAAFAAILTEMQFLKQDIAESNVTLIYTWSQLDDPAAVPSIVTPLITVQLTNLTHEMFLLPQFVGVASAFPMPDFASTRTAHSRNP
jgi:Flp pilus assembly protein TadG